MNNQIWLITASPVSPSRVIFAGTSAGFGGNIASNARFNRPTELAITSNGNTLFVLDTNNRRIRSIDMTSSEKTVSTLAGSHQDQVDGIGTNAMFSNPRSMCIHPNNLELFVTDGSTIRRIIISTREVTTIAGSSSFSGNTDHFTNALGARFSYFIKNIRISNNQLYIADTGNFRIRVMDLVTNSVTTVAGSINGITDGVGISAQFSEIRTLHIIANNSILIASARGPNQNRLVKIEADVPCFACPSNSVSAFNNAGCTCANSIFDGSIGTCGPCVVGSYLSMDNTCISCGQGKYSTTLDATSCVNCPAGTWNGNTSSAGLESCIQCGKGTYNSITGATSINECLQCPLGKFHRITGVSRANFCHSCLCS